MDEISDDEKADGRVLIRGSSLRPAIRNWRKFEIDEKSGNISTLISLAVLTALLCSILGRLQCNVGILASFWASLVNFGRVAGDFINLFTSCPSLTLL